MKIIISKSHNHVWSSEALQVLHDLDIDVPIYCQNGYYHTYDANDLRTNDLAIGLMEQCGSEYCSGFGTELKIVEVPINVDYTIEYEKGRGEYIVEKHRVWE